MRRVNYAEGDVFVFPLRSGGHARGVVARADGKGMVLGYFFGPRLGSVAEARPDDSLEPDQAVLVGRLGDLGLLDGAWRIVGRVDPWSRSDWPLPPFSRRDGDEEDGLLCYYNEDTLAIVEERRVPAEQLARFPADRVMGYGAVEIRVGKLLQRRGGAASPPDTGSSREPHESPTSGQAPSIRPNRPPDQAVLVHVASEDFADLSGLEDDLEAALRDKGAGEYDGWERGEGNRVLYLYGPSADRLYQAIASVLRRARLPAGSYAVRRYGEPGAREARVDLGKRSRS